MHVLLTGNTTFKLANFRRGLIEHLIEEGHRVSVLSPPDDYVDVVLGMGCDFMPISMSRNGTSPLAELGLLQQMFRAIRRLSPDVVFSYTIKNNIYSGLSCRLLGVPYVPNVTGLGPAFNDTGVLNQVVRLMYRSAFHKAEGVFFQNAEDLATFRRAGLVSEDRGVLLPGSGVNLLRFTETPMRPARDETVFLLVARMLWDKGVGLFAEAARKVRTLHPTARFQLLGPLDLESRSGISKQQIEAWVSEGDVEYLGSTSDVAPHLKAADCVVLPSFYREGTPRSLLEAGAIGRPIITTDMPGCRDLVVQGQSGYIVSPRDPIALESACIKFLHLSQEARQTMGRESRRLVAERYDEKHVISAYAAFLRGARTPGTMSNAAS